MRNNKNNTGLLTNELLICSHGPDLSVLDVLKIRQIAKGMFFSMTVNNRIVSMVTPSNVDRIELSIKITENVKPYLITIRG